MTCAASDKGAKDVMNYIAYTQTLVDSFNTLADEVQGLTDRNIILEHKLRFAHEQVCCLYLSADSLLSTDPRGLSPLNLLYTLLL